MRPDKETSFSTLSGYDLLNPIDLDHWMSNMKQTAYSIGRYRKDSDLLDVEELETTKANYLMLCRDIRGIYSAILENAELEDKLLPLDSEEMGVCFEGVNHFREIEGKEPVDFRYPTLGALKDWCGLKFETFGKSLTPPKHPLSWFQLTSQSTVSGTWPQPELDNDRCLGLAQIKIHPETGALTEVVNDYGLSLNLDTDNQIGASPYVEAVKNNGLKTEAELQKEQSIYTDVMQAVDRVIANESEDFAEFDAASFGV